MTLTPSAETPENRSFDRIAYRLDKWKRQLIDLTRRNRLLNYRPTKASTVEIVDELPGQIFRQLLQDDSFTFDPKPEKDQDVADDDSQSEDWRAGPPSTVETSRSLETGRDLEQLHLDEMADHHRDTRLQTRLEQKRLNKNLLAIYRRATESLEEQGINTLFLALGMLEWYEDRNSDVKSRAPLVMVPVNLERKTAASAFQLSLGEDDPILNPAIVEKVRLDFKIDLPALPEFSDDLDIDKIFDEIRSAVKGFPRWRLTGDVVLGLFSFKKFIMYRDIERNEKHFRGHSMIQRICNEAESPGHVGLPPDVGKAELDEEMAPWDTVQVLDADSSQQRAMLAVRKGYDLVIEGPPGTGKSQTIANIISDALYRGETVLFVSEKMAALDVVKSRLEHEAGLGPYVLEIHSNKASKRQFVEELSRSLDHVVQTPGGSGDELKRLKRVTEELKHYVIELHRPEEPLGWSPFAAIGRFTQVEDAPRVRSELKGFEDLSQSEFQDALARLTELSRRLRDVGDPRSHPLRGLGLESAGHSKRAELEEALEEAASSLTRLTDAAYDLSELLGLKNPGTLGESQVMLEGARVVVRSPGAETSILENPKWNELSADIRDVIETGDRYRKRSRELQGKYRFEILDRDRSTTLSEYDGFLEKGFWRFFVPSYWRARKELRSFLEPGYKPEDARTLSREVAEAEACRVDREAIQAAEDTGQELFGRRWNGPESDWDELTTFAEWVTEFRQYALKELLADRGVAVASEGNVDEDAAARAIQSLDEALEDCRTALAALVDAGEFGENGELHPKPERTLSSISRRLCEIEEGLPELRSYSGFVAARNACQEGITRAFVERALEETVEAEDLVSAFRRQFLVKWIEHVVQGRPVLQHFHSGAHEDRLSSFRKLDLRSLDLAKDRTRLALEERRQELLSSNLQGQLQILQREAKKRSRIMPIRKLFRRAPDAIARVKPCFMMSPLSVAQFLETDGIHFDLVVFDEASQIPPADAIGAIIRGAQTVVVGDSKQLPPTNFFGVHLDDEDMEEDEEIASLDDLESILDEVAVCGIPSMRLKWHYRSQHQSLIRFSNEEFYSDDPLYVFPAPVEDRSDLGLHFEFLEDATYTGKGQNPVEAKRVADAVVRHIKETPELSLGVGTFGISQQSRILDELDERRRDDPSIEWFFNQKGEEKFFVKNLENIQGDDRDVIFLSVTYGPDENGVVRRNFGPINKKGGWRRLNVLTTRAKRLLKVFSSMSGDQIGGQGVAKGAILLRQYLKYAQTGEYPSAKIPQGPAESPFEKAVKAALERKGYRIRTQVGDAGYRIDLGVVDEERPGRYLCGIECDGASYHSAATVRDRDRIRQQVLELRGWDIHRVWSTDWFHDPRTQANRLERLIEESRERPDPEPKPRPEGEPGRPDEESEEVSHRGNGAGPDRPDLTEIEVPVYRFAQLEAIGGDFHSVPMGRLSDNALRIIKAEGPVHVSEVARRLCSAYGIKRAGKVIQQRAEKACRNLVKRGAVEEEEDFFWSRGLDPIPVRSRNVNGATFSSDMIAPCEVAEAIRLLLKHRAPVLPDDLVTETARLLGFGRTGRKLRARINGARERLTSGGELRVGGLGLHLSD